MIPPKLSPGEEVRVVAPASSHHVISGSVRETAIRRLERLGLRPTFGARIEECDEFNSSSIEARLEDLHAAFADPQVKAVLTSLGGYNSNELLSYLDYGWIGSHPRIFCGFSDITALGNAIYAKTGLVTYSGPHFSTFGMELGFDYTQEYFQKCLFADAPIRIQPASDWSDDAWYRDQEARTFFANPGWLVIHEGQAEGTLLGGNLCTLNLLQGTEFMPGLAGSILLLEDDYESRGLTFDRDLQSLIHQPGFLGVQALLIGRFQKESAVSNENLIHMIETKRELERIPVIANLDFGHTSPQFTFPIGGRGRLAARADKAEFEILEH